ncbi:hypothetical protein [Paramagnetospirillum kuznetsovii]|uniref:hypothetical protein n=1 Tax=Paramagnetospirillum kuznetsovii TaxID=2053833 RepID=UPI001374D0AD|nr:hypothetical protein [Paramagnetospirillum kuznetsovii]
MTNLNTSINSTCKSLISERENWEKIELAASNTKLYSILSRCFEVYKQLKQNQFLVEELDKMLTAKGIKFTAAVHPANKLIKLIFGDNDRRRVSAYATVMKAAHENASKATADFAAWVKREGGIEAIRTGNATTGGGSSGTTSDPEAFNKAAARLGKEAAIASIAPSSKFPEETGYVMVLARIAPDRSLSVVKFIGKVNDERAKSIVIKAAAAEDADCKASASKAIKTMKKNIATKKRADEKTAKEAKAALHAKMDKRNFAAESRIDEKLPEPSDKAFVIYKVNADDDSVNEAA